MERQEPKTPSDEIDLQDLAVRVIKYFRKNLKFIIFSSLAGLGLSMVTYKFTTKVYESKMILMSDILTESYSERITESINNLIIESNNRTLANRLSLSEAEADQLNKIQIESVKKEKAERKDDANIFIVTVDLKDKTILPKLQSGIIQFLRNNEYVKIRVRQKKDYLQAVIKKIGLEIQSLDSLKKRLFSGLPIYSKTSEMLLVDPTSIYSKIIELNKEQFSLRNSLELVDSIQLVEGFTVFEKPASPKLFTLLSAGLIAGFLFSIGLLTFTQLLKIAKSDN